MNRVNDTWHTPRKLPGKSAFRPEWYRGYFPLNHERPNTQQPDRLNRVGYYVLIEPFSEERPFTAVEQEPRDTEEQANSPKEALPLLPVSLKAYTYCSKATYSSSCMYAKLLVLIAYRSLG
jgi:hypothetical protein